MVVKLGVTDYLFENNFINISPNTIDTFPLALNVAVEFALNEI